LAAHVFVDTTNIFFGARDTAARVEPDAPSIAVRLYYPNLFRLIEGRDQIATRVLAGSIVGPREALTSLARRAGYETMLFDIVARDQAVEELLHLKIANCLLDHDAGEQVLVLVTGEGNQSTCGTSFPGMIERALKHGWSVQVWSWKLQLSTAYRSLATHPKVRVQCLDPYYPNITFVKGGQFEVMGATKASEGRRMRELVLP
jgi:hypothetical protein